MIAERSIVLAGIPTLVATAGAPRGAVLLLHGLGGSREVQRAEAHSLARHGYVAITPDAFGHGARRFPDFETRFSPERAERSFFEVVQRTADELPALLAELENLGWARPGSVGACGMSMGGAVLYGAIAAGCRFAAAATVVASPRWRGVEPSPHERPDRFFPTPLLIQTAGADAVVPPDDGRAFAEALVAHYAPDPQRLRYLEHPGEAHLLTAPAWERAWSEVLRWLDRWVAP